MREILRGSSLYIDISYYSSQTLSAVKMLPCETDCIIINPDKSDFLKYARIIRNMALRPVTKIIVGTQIGTTAALVPLSLGVFPFYARQVQVALSEVSGGNVEAAQSVGASCWESVFGVNLREGRSELVRVSTVTLISLIGLTAMAGAIGAGGLGNMAISYGYNRFATDTTLVATLLVLILVLVVQVIGDILVKRLNHK
jgi:D-methionine transport system permease protein